MDNMIFLSRSRGGIVTLALSARSHTWWKYCTSVGNLVIERGIISRSCLRHPAENRFRLAVRIKFIDSRWSREAASCLPRL